MIGMREKTFKEFGIILLYEFLIDEEMITIMIPT